MPATIEQIETLLKDVQSRLASTPTPMTEADAKLLISNMLNEKLASDGEFMRKMRFDASPSNMKGSKFARWGLGAADVEFLYDLQNSLKGQRKVGDFGGMSVYPGPSEELENCFKSISEANYLPAEKVAEIDKKAIDSVFPRIPLSWFHGYDKALAVQGRFDETGAYRRAMDSAESGYGSQLVGAQYVGDLWEAARQDTKIFGLIDSFEMTAPTTYLPVEVDIPEMYFVSESADNNSSNYGTVKTGSQRVQVDAKKFVIHQMWSGEIEEDSIIPFIPFLRRQAQYSLSHYSDSLVLNGDTTNAGTGNINLDDADPADTKHYLAFDGLRHIGIVDNTNNIANMAGALTSVALMNATERMHDTTRLVHWGFPANPTDVIHIMDSATYITLLGVTEVITVDKFGPRATILTGQLASIWNHPIIVSEAMSKTEADGKVSTTGGNNTLGQVCTFNRRAFKTGWRRRVKLETERLPGTDQTRLVYSLRLGFGRFTPTGAASGIEAADIIRNITV